MKLAIEHELAPESREASCFTARVYGLSLRDPFVQQAMRVVSFVRRFYLYQHHRRQHIPESIRFVGVFTTLIIFRLRLLIRTSKFRRVHSLRSRNSVLADLLACCRKRQQRKTFDTMLHLATPEPGEHRQVETG